MIDPELQGEQDPGGPAADRVPAAGVAARDAQGAIDWQAVRARLADVGRRLQAEEIMDGASEVELLSARALALARRVDTDTDADRLLVVRVSLGGSTYAVQARHIASVVKQAQVALLPGATPPAVALASWRGRLLPALDVRALLGHPTTGTNEFLVIGIDSTDKALLVDQVLEMQEVEAGEVGPVPGTLRRSGLLSGILSDGTPVLDIEEVVRLGAPATGNNG